MSWKGRRRVGAAVAGSHRYGLMVDGGPLDLGAAPGEGGFGTIVAAALRAIAGDQSLGGSFHVLRPGSNIRAGGFAAKQLGSTAANTGLVFLITGTAGGGEAEAEAMILRPDGHLELLIGSKTLIVKGADNNRYRLSVPSAAGPATWVAL